MLSPVEEIKNKLDIVEVVSGYIKLQKAGRYFKANCPFHSEKTPSFFVTPERQIWRCFGCGKGGDIFGFVKEIEGMDFSSALKLLAQRAGVTLKKQDPKLKSERQRLLEICELSTKFFSKQLESSEPGAKIIKYLSERGINHNSIESWRIGFAPDDWRVLSDFLKKRSYTDAEIIKSGVVVEKEGTKNYYDRFRNRVIFPIFDLNGQTVGFAGRMAPGGDEKSAKYINTPQTLIYDKSGVLYGLDKAKVAIRKKNYCVVVEGNTDVIMSHQAGIENTVASSGTALTGSHLRIIKRYTENLILGFDLDLAGDTATKRAIDLAVSEGFNVKIASLALAPGGKKNDPADIIRENPRTWLKALKDSQEIIAFYFTNAFAAHDAKEVRGKKAIAKILLPLLKKLPDKIEQAHWIQVLARRLKVQEKFLLGAIKELKISGPTEQRKETSAKPAAYARNRRDILEEELLALTLLSPNANEQVINLNASVKYAGLEKIFLNSDLMKIMLNLEKFLGQRGKEEEFDLKKWQAQLPDDLRDKSDQLIFQLEVKQEEKDFSPKQFDDCLKEIKKNKTKQELISLRDEIRSAEENKDKKNLDALLKKFKKLANELVSGN